MFSAEELGAVDVVVNNAGVFAFQAIEAVTEAEFHRQFDTNVLGIVLTAQEAFNLGMVSKVVPDAEVEEASRELAMSLAQGPSIALGFIKRNINNAETMSLEACFDGEAFHQWLNSGAYKETLSRILSMTYRPSGV